ncbi:hypothetical protein HDU87_000529 [Geranomyces variabilis]|uniref:Uncharacterized protein n=1 Tax=Geranomyces variabilis TaxID=109894 RepID=A0AAD5XJF5_9FUNG|nr:hypothetical protein HDU87_000529 [Geranomyces variabilis]
MAEVSLDKLAHQNSPHQKKRARRYQGPLIPVTSPTKPVPVEQAAALASFDDFSDLDEAPSGWRSNGPIRPLPPPRAIGGGGFDSSSRLPQRVKSSASLMDVQLPPAVKKQEKLLPFSETTVLPWVRSIKTYSKKVLANIRFLRDSTRDPEQMKKWMHTPCVVCSYPARQAYSIAGETFLVASCPLPAHCAYLFSLNLPDEDIVIKWGRTHRMHERADEHRRKFDTIRHAEVKFHKAIWVDPMHEKWAFTTCGSETLRGGRLRHSQPYNELAAIPPKQLDTVLKLYDSWQAQFGGGYESLVTRNQALKGQLIAKQNEADLLLRARELEIDFLRREAEQSAELSAAKLCYQEQEINFLKELNAEKLRAREQEVEFLRREAKQTAELYQLRLEAATKK